jgi:hypothetical protein
LPFFIGVFGIGSQRRYPEKEISMNKQVKWWSTVSIWIAVLVATFSFNGCARSMGPRYVMPLEQMIESAKTKADHESLAAYYEEEAMLLQEDAEQHERTAKSYEKMDNYFGYSGMLVQHCNHIATKYREAAEENWALAKLHRDLAVKAELLQALRM